MTKWVPIVGAIAALMVVVAAVSCFGEGQTLEELPRAVLVDEGFRIAPAVKGAAPVLTDGRRVRRAAAAAGRYSSDSLLFAGVADYVYAELEPFQARFQQTAPMDVVEKYLQKRDADEILRDGFYIGCNDICTVMGAVLVLKGYECELVHTVSSRYTETHDLGHVFLCVRKGVTTWLIDPSSPGSPLHGFNSDGSIRLHIASPMADLFVFAVHENPRVLGIVDRESLSKARAEALREWQRHE